MRLTKAWVIIVCWLVPGGWALSVAGVVERSVDPMTSTKHWRLGGRRINYSLGASSLEASSEQPGPDGSASLKLTYDFDDPRRNYVSAYHVGEAIPGRCGEVSFGLYGNASGLGLRLSIEDSRGRWFERDAGTLDREGWKHVRVAIGDGGGWRPLLRRGETRLAVLHPVNLRQIAVFRTRPTASKGAVYLRDLRAKTDVVPASFITARLNTGREANLFHVGQTPSVNVELASRAREAVAGALSATVTDFFGHATDVDLGSVTIPPGGTTRKQLRYPTDRIGTYTVRVRLRSGGRERLWFARFAVGRTAADRPADLDGVFGCMFNLTGFRKEQAPLVLRLNRDAGIRWARIRFEWEDINPAPGIWAWDAPKRVDGPVGSAARFEGQVLRVPHSSQLSCRDAVTIAFWARGTRPNGRWQTPLHKWGHGDRRNYGVYFHAKNGNFCFSASYARFPDHKHVDFDSGFRAWDHQWHHYAATYDRRAKKVVLYVDGRARASADHDGGELRTNEADLVVGWGCPAGLDEMRIYGRALDSAEIEALALKRAPPTRGLIAWWSFDDVGSVISDRSGHRLDLARDEPPAVRTARLALANGMKTLGLLGFPPIWASTARAAATTARSSDRSGLRANGARPWRSTDVTPPSFRTRRH